MRVLFTVQLKKHAAGACIVNVIICKLGYWYELCLMILLKVDKRFKIGLYSTVLSPSLITGLWVEGNREVTLDAKKVAKRETEL